MDRLKDKIAVVTGAASGIGRGTVELFVAEGARVLAADISDEQGRELERRFNGQVKFHHCDVTSEDDIKATMQAAKDAFGGIDILFNNAGAGGSPNTIEDMTGEAWDRSMNLLLRSVALGTRYAIPFLKARGGGSIINTASVAALQAGVRTAGLFRRQGGRDPSHHGERGAAWAQQNPRQRNLPGTDPDRHLQRRRARDGRQRPDGSRRSTRA
ncbi:MAG: SDR family oxidoreductase [Rhizomicrobium sp.]